MKKNAIDGMMTDMNGSNFHWAHDAPVGKAVRSSKKHNDGSQFHEKSRQANLSTNLKKDLLSGSGLTHEFNRFTGTGGMWGTNTNKST